MRTNDYLDLTGKVALVTGGSRGLGKEIALAYARQGADVIIVSRKLEACEEVAGQIRELGRRALSLACHMGKWSDIDSMLEVAYAQFGRIDILVNNAGMSPLSPPSHETSEELFDKVVSVNFKGPFRLAAQVGARMAEGEGGSIINVSSTGALRPLPAVIPYCGAKAALNAMSESLAKEYGPKVRVNTLSAGPFLTDISNAWPAEAREKFDNALGRPGKPHEIIVAALYLASPFASFSTGSMVRVDGGIS
ncbi:SDR family NAD(P)-dependent oxidoreductase [Pseudomonas sp. PDM31]|uniref:SDR family NAD(P)-dependent oxidoreductase n=1 Tax=Pseudomonas sp. PDM31 TaxID=2854778 RepID=UPI001C465073|nr:SDR family oxidoreductase [Pseudomonas sp. PDM31]MBV7477618.1 SDR family oxidoreductase [Pseudomonas sp. PDM31]